MIYLKYNWKNIIYAVGLVTLGCVVLLLEGVGIDALIYPCMLIFFLLGIYAGAKAYKEGQKSKEIELAQKNIDITLERLPEAENLVEIEYQALLKTLFEKKEREAFSNRENRRELEEFLTIWTHQIKTPLTALELASKDLPAKEEKDFSGRLFEIEQYCDTMLTYLRIEGEGTDYLFQKQNVRAMVGEAVRYFARSFIAKGLSVKIEIDEEASLVTDEKWMVFVLKQVISNALKYTVEGSITIDMPDPFTIRVTDTGIGISQEDLPRIMERGYTGYNGRIDKKATGMGLFLVKQIMDMLGGKVWIDSELGKGSAVYLKLRER